MCGERYSRDNWRDPKEVTRLLGMRAHFAAIGKASEGIWLDGWDAFGSMFPGVFQFFAEHATHEMSVFDEYGRRWSEAYDAKRRAIYAEMAATPLDQQALLRAQLDDLNQEQETP